jgi:hypothetical protein
MLCDLGNRPIHLFVVNPTWGRRARHVRLSRCQDGAREILSTRECSCAKEEQAFSAFNETLRIQQVATAGLGCSPRGFTLQRGVDNWDRPLYVGSRRRVERVGENSKLPIRSRLSDPHEEANSTSNPDRKKPPDFASLSVDGQLPNCRQDIAIIVKADIFPQKLQTYEKTLV